MRPAQKR